MDIACGVGFGTHLLAERGGPAVDVLGVDLSEQAVRYAGERYGGDRARFLAANAMEFSDGDGFDASQDCDDDDACTLDDACQGGVCQGGASTLGCDDGNTCTDDSCDPTSGCVSVDNEAPCDDQDACTVGDACADTACVAGADALACNDENGCTDDTCDPISGCDYTANSAQCDELFILSEELGRGCSNLNIKENNQ